MTIPQKKSKAYSSMARSKKRARVYVFRSFLAVSFACILCCGLFAQEQRRAPEISGTVWFNSGAYKNRPSMKVMRGKVILMFFWTLNDPTCENVATYLNNWYEEYKDRDFEIIGVHTPEWRFNNSESELFKKVDELGILFPIVVDSKSSIRNAYGRLMWPSFTLIDRDGYIRAQFEGVAGWRAMRRMLETLLEESGYDPRLRRAEVQR